MSRLSPSFQPIALILVTVLGCSVLGCDGAPSPGEACHLAEDQWNSFMPPMHWNSDGETVDVTIDDEFSEGKFGHQGAIERGIQVWNDFSGQTLHGKFFRSRVGFVHQDTGPKNRDDLGCDHFVGGSDDRFSIVRIADESRWKSLGYTASVPAVTARCYEGGHLKKQAILINVNHVNDIQLSGIVIHELGHAIGLKHSCRTDDDSDGKKNDPYYISCSEVNEKGEYHPYRVAVMYPVFGSMERKSSLRKNDMWRAYCQYQDK